MNTANSINDPAWVRAAVTRPVAFAQVREDPLIDRWVVECCARDANAALSVIQIASGGCTAALLAALPQIEQLQLVDPNPAQLALTRLKLHLLSHHTREERLAVLGHAAQPMELRCVALRRLLAAVELPEDICGPVDEIAAEGLDHAGRYELLFAALRHQLTPVAAQLQALLRLGDLGEQQRRTARRTVLGDALDAAFAEVMALEHLVRLFGESATSNAAKPFAEHFAARLRQVLATLPAHDNPFVWQLLAGSYPPGHPAAWITLPSPTRLPLIDWNEGTMDASLASAAGQFHVVHLSNILDWLAPAAAAHTLQLAWQALRPGGWVVIRQLNSLLDIPALAPQFAWSTEATALHATDRSFFYRALHLGRRQ